MPSLPELYRIYRYRVFGQLLSTVILTMLLPVAIWGQGEGAASTGTGGSHIISGKIFFPSGRKLDTSVQVRLQSFNSGEISVMSDSSGSFTFASLSPGNYTVVIDAGKDYEGARENVTIDSDVNLTRIALPTPPVARRYTVMITLQPKRDADSRTKASVVNAALVDVPENARQLYDKGLELARKGDAVKAIDSLKAAISLYPRFPQALNELGVQYLRLGQASKAIEPLRSASKLGPNVFSPRLNFGIALLETLQFAEAETQLREALKISSVPTAHMYLGLALAHLHNWNEAETELKRAIDLSGNELGLAHYYLAGLYWQRRDYRRAADELETYLRLTPNAQDAERVRGTIKELRAKS
jgi:tetratricopeptide (TPR) repeat protein